ncbi:MAG: hypothetical protein IJ705_08975 [Oscillospiraceae bacterium]|nr:hypothetical protein [Oscillospiraceae bacterium]
MTSAEKVAYLKGLMEGMELKRDSGEGKLLSVIADILGDMAEDIEDLESDLYDLSEDVDAISDDLSDVEDILRDGGDWEDDGEDDGEPRFYEVTCPACNNTITVDEDVLALGRVQCPNCGDMMEFDLEDVDADDRELKF